MKYIASNDTVKVKQSIPGRHSPQSAHSAVQFLQESSRATYDTFRILYCAWCRLRLCQSMLSYSEYVPNHIDLPELKPNAITEYEEVYLGMIRNCALVRISNID